MKHPLPLLCLGAAVLAMAAAPLQAADKKPTPTPTPRHTVIGSVSSDSITINTGLTTKTFQIDKHTKFNLMGKPVTVGDLKPGMRVSVTPGGFDGKTADIINASDVPKAPPATPAAKKK
ncbi:MAG: hypothetical protein PHQ12_08895 [Chthoniobacteraceae bacterium]|nr:hypothetical protein [Chthoniobacteraceae bacterium]